MSRYKVQISKEEINELPIKAFIGEIHLINSLQQIEEVCDYLKQFKILGFDTETRPVFKKKQKRSVALLQLSTPDEAFLFRLNKIGLPDAITEILSSPEITKPGVAIQNDIKELQQRNYFEPKGFVELQKFVRNYDIQDAGLRKLTANILGFRISKSQQISNWEKQILSKEQISYAATDAWVSCLIYKELTR